MSAVLEVKSLRKEFGDLVAVDGISFDITEGEIFGFLGPNGAGKTTSISMICGLLTPTAGEIHVEGVSILKNPREVKRKLGVVPQEVAIYEELSARENLTFWGGISTQQTLPYGTPDEVRAEVDRVVRTMSRGGGYITSPAQEIQSDVPLENMLALIEQAQSYT